jgi:hypothetical protein
MGVNKFARKDLLAYTSLSSHITFQLPHQYFVALTSHLPTLSTHLNSHTQQPPVSSIVLVNLPITTIMAGKDQDSIDLTSGYEEDGQQESPGEEDEGFLR